MYPRETWRKFLRKANELDINKGGYCDKEDLTWVKAEFEKLWQATFPTLPKPKITEP